MSREHPQPFTGRRGRENYLAQDTRVQGGAQSQQRPRTGTTSNETENANDQKYTVGRVIPTAAGTGTGTAIGDAVEAVNQVYKMNIRRERALDETVQRTQSSLLWTILRCFWRSKYEPLVA